MTDGETASHPGYRTPAVSPLLSASEAARALIRRMIESGEFGPGARLNPDELGDLLGVSRTPVRDALHQLRTEGLVDIQPRKGVFVREVSPKEVDEVYALKAAVEPVAAGWAAERGTAADKEALSRLLHELRQVASTGDVREAAEVVDRIHDQIFAMADSSVLTDVYSVFHGRVRLLRHLNMAQEGRLEATVRHHSEIVDLVVAGDAPGAQARMTDHLRDAAVSVRKAVSEQT